MIKKWLNSDLAVLVKRILTVYAALWLCRAVFYVYNRSLLGVIEGGEVWPLVKGALTFDTASVVYAFGLFILLSLVPFRITENRWYRSAIRFYYIIAFGVTVAVGLADAVYYHYAQKRFTSDEALFAGNDNSAMLVLRFAMENWYLVLLAVLMVWMAWKLYRRCGEPVTPVAGCRNYVVARTIILAVVATLCVGGARGGFSRTTRPITLSNATLYTPSVAKANLILSNPFCVIRTMGRSTVRYVHYYPAGELEEIFTPVHYPPAYYPSLGERNIVIFMLESFSAEHSAYLSPELYPAGRGYTPFLDSLMRESYTFTSAFSNGRKSIDALPSVLASIPSFKTPFVLLPQSLGRGEALPQILAGEGYSTSFFCGSPRGSMGFGAYATAAGVNELYSQQEYEKAHGTKDRDGYWGIWDEPFLQYMSEELDRQPQPFFSSVFTLSSHHPFVVPEEYEDSLPGGTTRIHKGVGYTDMALRRFFERSRTSDWFANTIFVFVADHVSSETFAPETLTPTGNSRIVTFIYTPDGAVKGVDPRVMQQINIMPTLLGLIGYDVPYFAFGMDMLREMERKPVAVNYMNQTFQAITDSVVVFFDEERVVSAYMRGDKLQKRDIAGAGNGEVDEAERLLKAVIQQYYSHVERKTYLVPKQED